MKKLTKKQVLALSVIIPIVGVAPLIIFRLQPAERPCEDQQLIFIHDPDNDMSKELVICFDDQDREKE